MRYRIASGVGTGCLTEVRGILPTADSDITSGRDLNHKAVSHDLDNNIPYLGGISATTTSIRIVLFGYWTRDTHKSFMRARHFTWLESKENRSLYGLVMSRFNLSMTAFGMRL